MLAKRGYETSILALAAVVSATPLRSTVSSGYLHGLFAPGEGKIGGFSLGKWSADIEDASTSSQTRHGSSILQTWGRFLDTLWTPRGILDKIRGRHESCELCERTLITAEILNLSRDSVSTILVTTTLTTTSTLTSFSATVISTVTQTLTFVDPSQPTRAVPPALQIKRSNSQQSIGAEATALLATNRLSKRQQDTVVGELPPESTITVTATSILTTVVTVQGGTRTRFHTVFETTRIALVTSSTLSSGSPEVSSTAIGPTNSGPGATPPPSFPAPSTTSTSTRSTNTVITVTITTGSIVTTVINPTKTLTQTIYPSSAPSAGPSGQTELSLRGGQISGIVLGVILFIVLLIILTLLLLRKVQNRRSAEASQRQQLSPEGGMAPFNSPATSHSTPGGAGQVRIVIRPAPPSSISAGADTWPIPPGHEGQPTLFLDNNGNTPGRTTPTGWSITSDFGNMPGSSGALRNSDLVVPQRNSGVPSSGVMAGMSPRPSSRDIIDGYYFTPVGEENIEDITEVPRTSPARNESQLNVSGAESAGGRSRGSSTFRTRLAPPPSQFGPSDWGGVGYGRAF